MRMIFRAADGERNDFMVAANPAEVGPQSRLPFFWDGVAAILGAKHQMDVDAGKGMRHRAAPSGLMIPHWSVPTHRFRVTSYRAGPSLRSGQARWATICRPLGTIVSRCAARISIFSPAR